MKFENIALEWRECRNTVARFDNYLLRLRLLGFSIFTLTFTVIAGATGSKSGEFEINREAILLAIITLNLFVLAIYILDRYYERMLLIAVLRASRLEAHRLEGFRIGLTTEIEFQKKQINRPIMKKKFSKASFMVNIVYGLIFLTMWGQYWILQEKVMNNNIYKIILGLIILFVIILFLASNSLLKEPNKMISIRANIVKSPVVMSREEIQHTVKRISKEIVFWLEQTQNTKLHIVSILAGARPFTEDLLANISKLNPEIEFNLHILHIEAHEKEGDGNKQCDLICGALDKKTVHGKYVLIIDDLLETGTTLKKVYDILKEAGAAAIKSAVIVKKFEESLIEPDFIGFNLGLDLEKLNYHGLKDCWLFGYGMDFDGHYREIEHIGWVERS